MNKSNLAVGCEFPSPRYNVLPLFFLLPESREKVVKPAVAKLLGAGDT